MKRILSVLLIAVLLCALFPASAFAMREEKVFWVTHFNDSYSEGSGVVFTEPYEHAGWWIHVAFEPVPVENTFRIVEIVNGLADGSASPLEIPENGFVWAANYGNDYTALGMGDTNFTSDNCNAAIAGALNWEVGQMFTFYGLDLRNLTVPTTTPQKNWYDDGYICTAYYVEYEGDAPGTYPDYSEEYTSAESAVEYSEEKDPFDVEDFVSKFSDTYTSFEIYDDEDKIDEVIDHVEEESATPLFALIPILAIIGAIIIPVIFIIVLIVVIIIATRKKK